MKKVQKEWGFEEIFCNNELYCSKFLHVSAGKKCSLHYHGKKDETFCLLEGECGIQLGQDSHIWISMEVGQSVRIHPNKLHRFASKTGCVLLETSTTHSDEDVIRLEPSGEI